jgi:ribosomal protein S18 acetylase RimI-like enzyme
VTQHPQRDSATDAPSGLLTRLEAFYDALPRAGARVEELGALRLFVRQGEGWPFYARPACTDGRVTREITVEDVVRAQTRQRQLGVPEAFEWVHDLAPSLTDAARQSGLPVELCPLLVLRDSGPVPAGELLSGSNHEIHVVQPDDDDLAAVDAVAHVGFGAAIGTSTGPQGTAERDARASDTAPERLERLRRGLRDGSMVRVVARGPQGPVCVGGTQHADVVEDGRTVGVAEIAGVATLPAFRRQGLAAAVTSVLAAEALRRGRSTVFLSAQDDDVARVYERVGFQRVGTAGIAEAK